MSELNQINNSNNIQQYLDWCYKNTPGLLIPGNIDLTTRPKVKSPDGSVSTELSISIGVKEGEVLIPRVINGKIVSPPEAINHYFKTGEHLGIFESSETATDYATKIHNREDIFLRERREK